LTVLQEVLLKEKATMKFQIIESSTDEVISSYRVSEISMIDFREWDEVNEVTLSLDELLDIATHLHSCDADADSPEPAKRKLGIYLPDPINREVLDRLVQAQANEENYSVEDARKEIDTQIRTPPLDLGMVLIVAVYEILRNHPASDNYKVRISDD
jgi:hypothetical protein